MKSNRTYHYLFKYGLLLFGLTMVTGPIVAIAFPGSIKYNGEPGPPDLLEEIILALLGLLFILIFFAIKDKFAIVELRGQTITVEQGREEWKIEWINVVSVSQIQFIQPPLYKLTTKDDVTIWFNTKPAFVSIAGVTKDLSEMGTFIEKKKRELGI